MITLENGDFGWDYLIRDEATGKDILIQTDYDYPGVASAFGWSPSKVPQAHCHVAAHADEEYPDCEGCEHWQPLQGPRCDACCAHDSTDGTVDCKCGVKAMVFIQHAQAWLDEHVGDSVEDPGYFDGSDEDGADASESEAS